MDEVSAKLGLRGTTIEATFERAAVEYRETSWSQGGDAAEMVVYDAEGARRIAKPLYDLN